MAEAKERRMRSDAPAELDAEDLSFLRRAEAAQQEFAARWLRNMPSQLAPWHTPAPVTPEAQVDATDGQ
jgi:hypothetical protein